MGNKVCCEEVKVQAAITFNDRDYLNDILNTEKELTKNMCTALTEASNKELHNELYSIFTNVIDLQQEAYELAWNNGWYKLEEAEKTKISQKQKEIQKKYDELSNKND
ncbi:MAG TPA: spore coat protein [Candidatus Coprovivens excrementavium]|nr:spore coat protein [Candidatus Coprovivens excrementavium]